MKKEKIDLFYGALLHDIGKVIQRATGERKKHALVGADWFDEIADNQVISDQIRYHMANYQSNKLGNDHLAYITYIADNIASGVDRRQSNEESDEDASAKVIMRQLRLVSKMNWQNLSLIKHKLTLC